MLAKNTLQLTEQDIRRTFDVNVISHFIVSRAFQQLLKYLVLFLNVTD